MQALTFIFLFLIKLNYYDENPPCIVLWHFELARQTLLDCVDGKFSKMHFMLDCITSFYNWKTTTKNSLSLSVDYALIFFPSLRASLSLLLYLCLHLLLFPFCSLSLSSGQALVSVEW